MPIAQRTLDSLARRTLLAMYDLAATSRPVHAGAIARWIGAKPSEVGSALCTLDARGLIWLSRCALTMPGLAVAAKLAHQRQARSRAA